MLNQNDEFVKIGEIAKETGLPVSTVRYYISLGLLSAAYRTPGSVRIFKKKNTIERIKEIIDASEDRTLEEIGAAV